MKRSLTKEIADAEKLAEDWEKAAIRNRQEASRPEPPPKAAQPARRKPNLLPEAVRYANDPGHYEGKNDPAPTAIPVKDRIDVLVLAYGIWPVIQMIAAKANADPYDREDDMTAAEREICDAIYWDRISETCEAAAVIAIGHASRATVASERLLSAARYLLVIAGWSLTEETETGREFPIMIHKLEKLCAG